MKIFKSLVAVALALIFFFSAFSKLQGMDAFEVYLFRSSFLGFDASALTARLLLAAELLTALLLLSRIRYKWGWWLGFGMTLIFSVFLLLQLLQGEEGNCFCFGELVELSPAESLLKNGVILLLFLMARSLRNLSFRHELMVASLLGGLSLATPLILSPPDIFIQGRFKPAEHDQRALTAALDSNLIPSHFVNDRHILAFYSTSCRYCKMASERISAVMSKNDLPQQQLKVIFWGDSVDASGFFEATHSLHFEYTELDTKSYLDITKGRMPLILLVEDGRVIDQMNYRTLDEPRILRFLGGEA